MNFRKTSLFALATVVMMGSANSSYNGGYDLYSQDRSRQSPYIQNGGSIRMPDGNVWQGQNESNLVKWLQNPQGPQPVFDPTLQAPTPKK